MIGFYDYTVVLTYASLLSAVCGIICATAGQGHPYLGGFFLLFSGFCDTFDGRVARTKSDRTVHEKVFGVQIDSLSDLVAFGVLPGAIGVGLFTSTGRALSIVDATGRVQPFACVAILVILLYVLCALIRLAYFNMLEQLQEDRDGSGAKRYIGLPVTMAALVFPLILLFNYVTVRDLTLVYFLTMPVMSLLFVSPIEIRKPGPRLIRVLVFLGSLEFFLLLIKIWQH